MSSRDLTTAELVVLSLVAERPRHGYEIDQVIVERNMRAWTDIGLSSIYYLLGRLEKAGFVQEVSSQPGPGPSRKAFEATSSGFAALRQGTDRHLRVPDTHQPFLLGLANLAVLTDHEAVEALVEHQGTLTRIVDDLLAARPRGGQQEWFVDELFECALTEARTRHDWIAGLVDRITQRSNTMDPVATTTAPAPLRRANQPRVVELPPLTMAVVTSVGDPDTTGPDVFPALYGAVYGLKAWLKKQGVAYTITAPRARWGLGPEDFDLPRDQWRASWAIPVPDGTTELPAPKPGVRAAALEHWPYGLVAEVLHIGSYAEEGPTIDLLHRHIADQGMEICGPHEELYVTVPTAKTQKTIIRYQVQPRQPTVA